MVVANDGDYAFNGSRNHFCLDLEEGKLRKDVFLVCVVFVADRLEELIG